MGGEHTERQSEPASSHTEVSGQEQGAAPSGGSQGSNGTSRGMAITALVLIVLITMGHYLTDPHEITSHNIFRRLYYLPVVLAAFAQGLRGGVVAALLASLAYIPHAFLMSHHQDPAPTLDKVFEILLYLLVGGLTGWLVERERAARAGLERSLQERAVMERELVRAGKLSALGQLLAGVAHELRNPLASIMGAAEALERNLGEDARSKRLVTLQLREIARLERVVSNFLAFARTGQPRRESIALPSIVQQTVELAQHQPEEGRFVLDDSLQDQRLHADPDQLGQILLNLTLNAIQAAGLEPYSITYLYRQRELAGRSHDCLGVRDAGPGIEPEHLEEIFEPFYTTRDSGSGLGLSLSSRIAEAHGGFIEVDCQPGATTFWLCLPRQPDH